MYGRQYYYDEDKDPDHAVPLKEWREQEGLTEEEDFLAALQEWSNDGIVPALCDEACEVEPDGRCPHGCPAVTLAVGII